MEWWLNHPEYGLNLSMISTLPDAPIYRYAIANGLIKNKIQYMKQGFPIINLTRLADRRFREIRKFVYNFNQDATRYRGKVIYSKKEPEKHNGKDVFSIKIECPECHDASEYRNMVQFSFDEYIRIICRDCHARLRVKTKECFSENFTLYNIVIFNMIRAGRLFIMRYSVAKSIFSKYPIFKLIYYKINKMRRTG